MKRKLILITALFLALQLGVVSTALAGPPSSGFWHPVRRGETLSSISHYYGVSAYTLCIVNSLKNCNYIRSGQSLWIPRDVTPPGKSCATYHTVARGQTLSGIGRYYGVNARAIAAANRIYDLNRIYTGQSLCIPTL